MPLYRTFFCSLFLFSCFLSASARQPLLRHYTEKDGLPSNVIYDVFQDCKGYIWFSTDKGVSRFDGSEFKNFSADDGIPDNEVFLLREDDRHRYWLTCYNNKACYLRNGKVYTAGNDSLCRRIDQEGVAYLEMARDKNGNCCLLGKRMAVLRDEGLYFRQDHRVAFAVKPTYYFVHQDREYLLAGWEWCLLRGREKVVLDTGIFGAGIFTGQFFYCLEDNAEKYVIRQWGFENGNPRLRKQFQAPCWIYKFERLPDGNLLCCTVNGLFVYDTRKERFVRDHTLPEGTCCNRTLADHEGNRWYTTLNDGVYLQLRASPFIINRQSGLVNNRILSLETTADGVLVAGDDDGTVSLIGERGIDNVSLGRGKRRNRNRVLFMQRYSREEILVGGDHGICFVHTRSMKIRRLVRLGLGVKAGVSRGHQLMLAHSSGTVHIDLVTGEDVSIFRKRTTAVQRDPSGTIWMGTLDGLYCYHDGWVWRYDRDTMLAASRITSLDLMPGGQIVAGTSTNGLYIIPAADTPPLHLDRSNGLSSNSCAKVRADSAGRLWVFSGKGLDRLERGANGRYSVYTYSLADGLPGYELNDVAVCNNRLYLATPDGIVVMEHTDRSVSPPRLHLQSVNGVWPDDASVDEKLSFGYDESDLQVAFSAISFAGGGDLQYKYFLSGGEGDTVFTRSRTINFSALRPGNYTLSVWAKTRTSPWTLRPVVLRFEVRPPWWKNPLLLLPAIAALLFLVAELYRRRIARIQAQAENKVRNRQQMAELEMKALRAQINPHFIFNALSSIQAYYSQNDELTANQYMTSFAQFIRKTLTHSQSHWLSLAEEADMLETYIRLEQMRFRQVFSYAIDIDPQVDAREIQVPAMLIQPYVENAINHGLRHLTGRRGILSLCFRQRGRVLQCIVEDNGIGLKEARNLRNAGRPSFGMSIGRQRIETINQMYGTAIRLQVIDREDLPGRLSGTRIEIFIPIKKDNHADDLAG